MQYYIYNFNMLWIPWISYICADYIGIFAILFSSAKSI